MKIICVVAILGGDVVLSEEPPREIVNSVGVRLVLVSAGQFQMGSEKDVDFASPVHDVVITKAFYMGRLEVTHVQWVAVMRSSPRLLGTNPFAASPPCGDCPVQVRWDEATSFCRRLTALPSERAEGRSYRLPTEAEWEYACRAGSATAFSFGDDDALLSEFAWFNRNARGEVHPGGQKRPNAWGLFDMHGNVAEWCGDSFAPYLPNQAEDPAGKRRGGQPVYRGGNVFAPASGCTSAVRSLFPADPSGIGQGFRVVMVAGQ